LRQLLAAVYSRPFGFEMPSISKLQNEIGPKLPDCFATNSIPVKISANSASGNEGEFVITMFGEEQRRRIERHSFFDAGPLRERYLPKFS